jgi:hypothetical protein
MITTDDRRDGEPADDDLLGDVRDLFEAIDPMPADLPDRVRLGLLFQGFGAELARLTSAEGELAAAARGSEQSRMVTFDSDSLTIMIRVDSNPDGSVRVDGWLAPPQANHVEMHQADTTITVIADSLGRFVFQNVSRGTVRLIVRPPGEEEAGEPVGAVAVKAVVTPALTLLPRLSSSDHTGTTCAESPPQRQAGG